MAAGGWESVEEQVGEVVDDDEQRLRRNEERGGFTTRVTNTPGLARSVRLDGEKLNGGADSVSDSGDLCVQLRDTRRRSRGPCSSSLGERPSGRDLALAPLFNEAKAMSRLEGMDDRRQHADLGVSPCLARLGPTCRCRMARPAKLIPPNAPIMIFPPVRQAEPITARCSTRVQGARGRDLGLRCGPGARRRLWLPADWRRRHSAPRSK